MLTTFLLQLVLPLAVIVWLALRRHPSHAAWGAAVLLAGLLFLLLQRAALWLQLPWYLPRVYSVLGLLAAIHSWRVVRARHRWPAGAAEWAGTAIRATAAVAACTAAVYVLQGGRDPGGTVDLAFPLHQGTYLVANGGRIQLLNAHVMTLTGDRFRAYRGQSYGVDMVRVDRLGRRARGLEPRDPSAYTIFGDSVFAPCAGRVVRASDGLADQPVPEVDRTHMAGNNVILDCGGVWVILGHLHSGSVLVAPHDTVLTGALIGRVGNTGNTSEPHLHVHAQRPGTESVPLGGAPLPIRLGGRFLARNDRVVSGP